MLDSVLPLYEGCWQLDVGNELDDEVADAGVDVGDDLLSDADGLEVVVCGFSGPHAG